MNRPPLERGRVGSLRYRALKKSRWVEDCLKNTAGPSLNNNITGHVTGTAARSDRGGDAPRAIAAPPWLRWPRCRRPAGQPLAQQSRDPSRRRSGSARPAPPREHWQRPRRAAPTAAGRPSPLSATTVRPRPELLVWRFLPINHVVSDPGLKRRAASLAGTFRWASMLLAPLPRAVRLLTAWPWPRYGRAGGAAAVLGRLRRRAAACGHHRPRPPSARRADSARPHLRAGPATAARRGAGGRGGGGVVPADRWAAGGTARSRSLAAA